MKRKFIVPDLTTKLQNTRAELIGDFIKSYEKSDTALKPFLDTVSARQMALHAQVTKTYAEMEARNKARIAKADPSFAGSVVPRRLTLFLQGGIRARSFKRFLGTATPDFNNSFQDTLYRGGHFGIGANFEIRDFTFGLTYSYFKTDNFANLTSKDFTIRRTDTSGNQAFIQEKKITAYTGKYARVEVNEFNADIVYSLKLNPSDTARLLINPYIRGSWHSRDTAFLRNYTNVGLGLYFLGKRRKFIGGIYIELPDINNNAEKAKPVLERNIQPPFQKLSFGIVTKINLSSVFDFIDKSRKPD